MCMIWGNSNFYLLFVQTDNIYKVKQDSLYFFLEGVFKENYLKGEILLLCLWFQSYDFCNMSLPPQK